VGRKTKPTEFAWLCESWDAANQRCVNTSPDRAHEHWLYLTLPQPLEQGRTYTVETGNLATNGGRFTFTFDARRTRSEAVRVNLMGYAPDAPEKFGYLYHWMGDAGGLDLAAWDGKPFHLLHAETREIVFSGTVRFRKGADNQDFLHVAQSPPHGNLLGAPVWECDFSAFRQPGEYVLAVPGIGSSFPFRIHADAYRDAFHWTMKGLFQNRSGIAIGPPHVAHTRPAPHNPRLTPGFEGQLVYTSLRLMDSEGGEAASGKPAWDAGVKGPIDTWGWYQDAGDWDGYPSHARVPTNLLFLYDLAPRRFTDGELNIPESGNGIPDLLDEAAWLPRFFHRTRHAIVAAGYGTGGVGGARVMGDFWGSDAGPGGVTRPSWEDTDRRWVVSGEEAPFTYKYTALAAHLAFLLRRADLQDPEGVDWAREARETWEWAGANLRPGDERPRHGINLGLNRLQAAAALYRLTGERTYHDAFVAEAAKRDDIASGRALTEPDEAFAALYFVLAVRERGGDRDFAARVARSLDATADFHLLESSDRRALRWGGNFNLPMVIGQSTTPIIAEAVFAYAVQRGGDAARDTRRLARIHTTADYFLGTNPLGVVWITGVGPRHPREAFHIDSWCVRREGIIPGIIPYGPWTRLDTLGAFGPWNNDWPSTSVYPEIGDWPGHERWFDQYCSPLSGEFTVHQNNGVAAVAYGFLTADGGPQLPVRPAR
jgi:hypothetical protein